MTQPRILHELITVTVGALGVPTTGVGIVPVDLNLDEMTDEQIGTAMAVAFRSAHTEAVREFGPKLSEAWASDPDRIRSGDEPTETET